MEISTFQKYSPRDCVSGSGVHPQNEAPGLFSRIRVPKKNITEPNDCKEKLSVFYRKSEKISTKLYLVFLVSLWHKTSSAKSGSKKVEVGN
jgi:hypothetical protein